MSSTQPNQDIRKMVRSMLEDAPSYGALPAPERQKLARSLVEIMSYIADPKASLDESAPVATSLADVTKTVNDRMSKKQDAAGKGFQAGAAREGAEVIKKLVTDVDFPKFVKSLIDGVYTSIVDSSIKQMQEYGKLLETVTKSVDQFAKEHISEQEAREFIAQKFPGQVKIDPGNGQLAMGDDDEGPPPDFKAGLQMTENVELNADNEKKIVLAAQIQMARQRQQTLAQMVMMGINRIIVTDGEIKASVNFDFKSHDTSAASDYAQMKQADTKFQESGGGWFSGPDKVSTTVSSSFADQSSRSDSAIEAKAKLAGSVTVRFKSETFPLEKLASSGEMGALQDKGTR